MPRQARIDAPGAVHHIIVRGIERRTIFTDDSDRTNFLDRLGALLPEAVVPCYAWSLMTNHVHLLLRSGNTSISTVMRRLLTGYAVSFNRRHRRYGHLFQNRYKSILCEEDRYLRQLVAYIHLNPLRAGIVGDLKELKRYPYTGHAALMGQQDCPPWQDAEHILALFDKTIPRARKKYSDYVVQWSRKGRCRELTGGGLLRSSGGWRAVREAYNEGIRLTGDERILGSSEFVEKTLALAGDEFERRTHLKNAGIDLADVTVAVCEHLELGKDAITSRSRRTSVVLGRGLIGYLAVNELGISGTEVARHLHVDRSTISRAAMRIEKNQHLKKSALTVLSRLQP
jgi:putative transposase